MLKKFYITFKPGTEYADCFLEIHAQDHHLAEIAAIRAHGTRFERTFRADQWDLGTKLKRLAVLVQEERNPLAPAEQRFFVDTAIPRPEHAILAQQQTAIATVAAWLRIKYDPLFCLGGYARTGKPRLAGSSGGGSGGRRSSEPGTKERTQRELDDEIPF